MTTTHRISTSIAVALALALAVGAVPASARPYDLAPNGSSVPTASAVTHTHMAAMASPTLSVPTPSLRGAAVGSGFDWGDAGIGAAGGFALCMVGLGGSAALSQRRTRRNRRGAALTS